MPSESSIIAKFCACVRKQWCVQYAVLSHVPGHRQLKVLELTFDTQVKCLLKVTDAIDSSGKTGIQMSAFWATRYSMKTRSTNEMAWNCLERKRIEFRLSFLLEL